MKHAITSDES